MPYNFKETEKKWSNYWLDNKIYKKVNDKFRPRFFPLAKLFNPNSKEKNINDYINLIKLDAISRIKRMQGYNVLFSIGFQTFGLDGEKYAIKTGNNPFSFSRKNVLKEIETFKSLGLSMDYDLALSTSEPEFYKWSQWLFSKLYEKNLAKNKDTNILFCNGLKRIVGSGEVVEKNGEIRTIKEDFLVTTRTVKQWFINMSSYNESLLDNLDNLDYPLSLIKKMKNIISSQRGYNLKVRVDGENAIFNTFLTRVDDLFGATFCLISKSNKHLLDVTSEDEYDNVVDFINNGGKNKTVFIGSFAINPVNGRLLPIWVVDDEFDYGNDFKICIPSTSIYDYNFAIDCGLDIIPIIDFEEVPYEGNGIHINSDFASDLYNEEANSKIFNFLLENGYAEESINYKLNDLCISDSIYFGETIPVIYFNDGQIKVLNSTELPLEHPNIVVKPSGNEYSPLYNAKGWSNVFSSSGIEGVRELSTMTYQASNSWYYLAFILKSNAGLLSLNSPDAKYELNKWLPIDLYLGDFNELDILYQRFLIKVLKDLDYLNVDEPFKKIIDMKDEIESTDNIDLNGMIDNYGADVVRLFLLDSSNTLNQIDLDIYRRYVGRIVRLFDLELNEEKNYDLNDLINNVCNAYKEYNYKQVIYLIGEMINEILKQKKLNKKEALIILKLLYPLTPFVCEELFTEFISKKSILSFEEWPNVD